jgi:hypothetical protein
LHTSLLGAGRRRRFSGTDGSVRSTSPTDAYRASRPDGGGGDLGGAACRPRIPTRESGRGSASDSIQISNLADQAFAAAGTPAGLTTPEAIPVQIRKRRDLRTGRAPHRHRAGRSLAVAATLSNAMDVTVLRAGQKFETAISQPRGGMGDPA